MIPHQTRPFNCVPYKVYQFKEDYVITGSHHLTVYDNNMKFKSKVKITPNVANIVRKLTEFKGKLYLTIVDGEYKKCGILESHKSYINTIISVGVDYIVTGSDDKCIGVWNNKALQPATPRVPATPPILVPTDIRINSIAHYKNRLYVAGDSPDIKVYSFPECQYIYSLEDGHTQSLLYLEVVPYCQNQICSCGRDGKVIIWNTETKSISFSVNEHQTSISSIRFFDCNVMCIGCRDGEVLLYYFGLPDLKEPEHVVVNGEETDSLVAQQNTDDFVWQILIKWNEKTAYVTDTVLKGNNLYLFLNQSKYELYDMPFDKPTDIPSVDVHGIEPSAGASSKSLLDSDDDEAIDEEKPKKQETKEISQNSSTTNRFCNRCTREFATKMCKECNAYFCLTCSNSIHHKQFFGNHKVLNYVFCCLCKQELKDVLADVHCVSCNKDYCNACSDDFHSLPDYQIHQATLTSLTTTKKEASELDKHSEERDKERQTIGLLSASHVSPITNIIGISTLGIYYTIKIHHEGIPKKDKLFTLKIFCKTKANSELNIYEQQKYEMECIATVRDDKPRHHNLMNAIGMFKDHPSGIFESDMHSFIYPPITTFLIMDNYPALLMNTLQTIGFPRPFKTIIQYICQMVDLLAYLYNHHNILFLDIPYDAIYLKENGGLVLTEFTGSVKVYKTDKSVDTYRIIGDKTYLAPELVDLFENQLTARVVAEHFAKQTTWILAVFIFQLLFGVHPYANYPECTPDDINSIPSEYPDEFKQFYYQMITWDKEARMSLEDVTAFFKQYQTSF